MSIKKNLKEFSKSLSDFDFSKIGSIPDYSNLNSPDEKPYGSNIDLSDYLGPSQEELTNLQIEKQNEILEFLKIVTLKQSKTSERQSNIADKQFKTIKYLTILSVAAAVVSTVFTILNFITSNQENRITEKTIELIEKKSDNTKTISNMSTRLLDLQNQVQILEKENKLLLKKNE